MFLLSGCPHDEGPLGSREGLGWDPPILVENPCGPCYWQGEHPNVWLFHDIPRLVTGSDGFETSWEFLDKA